MNTNTLHLKRAIRSNHGITKIPYTLSELTQTDGHGHDIAAKLLTKFGTVVRVKPMSKYTGWAHIQNFHRA